MFKCRGQRHKCLILSNICDSIIDCPLRDDEYLCDLMHHKCPVNCVCLALAVECLNLDHYSIYTKLYPYISVSIFFSYFVRLESALLSFTSVKYLKLKHKNISQVCNVHVSHLLDVLDLGYNCVDIIKGHCFTTLYSVKSILLNNNYIAFVESHAFYDLYFFKNLDLSNNFLMKLSANIIKGSSNLKLFILKIYLCTILIRICLKVYILLLLIQMIIDSVVLQLYTQYAQQRSPGTIPVKNFCQIL